MMVLKHEDEMISIKTANIGDRIESGGSFGTVKYIGLIEGYTNIWLGVDWDYSDRGKHNGSVNGVSYFCTRTPTSGSFIRPEKVHLGRSVMKAITSRYGQMDDEAAAKLTEAELYSIQKTMNAPFLEFVGFDEVASKQSNFQKLEVINLRLQNVSNIDGQVGLRELCPHVVELDVSKNLFTEWTTIFNICLQLELLKWLNVSENIMGEMPTDYGYYRFPKLKSLICGTMRLDWDTVLELGRVYPFVDELRAPLNGITTLDTPEGLFPNLAVLDLEGNPIGGWEEVCKLAAIPRLEHLNVENTGITRIYFQKSNMFPNLKKLVISCNRIGDWESIGELDKLQCLEDLRFLKNPILESETYATCIQLIIARIGNLQVLNGAVLRSDERKGAEYDYIKKYGLEWLSVQSDAERKLQFIRQHNRYETLIEKYGTPDESELAAKQTVIKVSLIEVLFVHNEKSRTKKLPPTILVQKLIMLAQKLFALSSRPTLKYVSGLASEIEIELNDEGKELGFYSVQDGDKIIVTL
ncbi:tubulin-specific chaperone E-like [Photinus pyralis]|nr:tubulin-specific chaperone E-like [Photinus pyralis]